MLAEISHLTSHAPFPVTSRDPQEQQNLRKGKVWFEEKMIVKTTSTSTIKCRYHTHLNDVIMCSSNDLKKRAWRSKVRPKMPLHSPNKHCISKTAYRLDISARRA
jgi:hypothetical protein